MSDRINVVTHIILRLAVDRCAFACAGIVLAAVVAGAFIAAVIAATKEAVVARKE